MCPDLVANFLDGAIDGFHRQDDAEYGGDNSEGRKCVGDLGHGGGWLLFVLMVYFQVLVHQRFEIECRDTAHHEHLHRVTEKAEGVMVREKLGVLRQDGTLGGLFKMGFKNQHSALLHLPKQFVECGQEVEVVRFADRGLQQARHLADQLRQYMERRRHDQRADGRTADDDVFGRFG